MFATDAKILIVDDSSFMRKAIRDRLSELSYLKVIEAADADGAKRLMAEPSQASDPIQLLISDIHMPGVSGLDLLKWIRQSSATKNLPVILLTSSMDKDEIVEAGKLGVSNYILKPLNTPVLREKMSSVWTKHGKVYAESLKR